jgi:predicted nucleotidyltransferase
MPEMLEKIEPIIKKYNLELLLYFGSYGTEFYHRESDIDIAFLSTENLAPEKKLSLLEDLIKYHKKSEIDLVDLRIAEPVLRYEIALHGRVIYEKEENLFEKYRLFYIKRFYELKPVIEEEIRRIGLSVKEVIGNAR